jgi:hypothetical protein
MIEGGVPWVWDRWHRLLARVQRIENRMYRLELQVARPLCLAVHQDNDAWRWHERLGHANFGSLEKMGRLEMVRGLPPISHAEQFCDTCVLTKHRREVFPKQSKYRVDKALGLSTRRSLWAGQAGDPRRTALFPTARRRCHPLHVGCAPDSQVGGIKCHQAHSGSGGKGMWPQAPGAEDRQRRGVHGGRVRRLLC